MSLGYDMLYAAALLALSPVWVYRLLRTGKWRTDWPARFGGIQPLRRAEGKPTVLVHAVSVGEAGAAAGIVAELHRHGCRVVVSVSTDTGLARARALFEPTHTVVRFPLDLGLSVRRFLGAVQPDLVALMELEVWPNFMRECGRRGVPVCVVNGRLTARSFRRYRWVRPLVAPMFRPLAAVAAQTRAYADRFIALGVRPDRVTVADSVKWDTARLTDPGELPGVDELATSMGIDRNRPLIVAGSTGPGEEKLLIDTCPTEGGVQLLLVPRKPERFDEVAALAGHIVRRSHYADGSRRPTDDTRLFLLDTVGELNKAYALADVAIVGRSFLGLYGSNPLEPIALGKPTIIGPHHADFSEMVEALSAAGALAVTDAPGKVAGELLADKDRAAELGRRGREVIRSRQGAAARQAKVVLGLLKRPTRCAIPVRDRGRVAARLWR